MPRKIKSKDANTGKGDLPSTVKKPKPSKPRKATAKSNQGTKPKSRISGKQRREGRPPQFAVAAEGDNDASNDVREVLADRSSNHPAADIIEDEWELSGEELHFSEDGKEALGPTITKRVIQGKFNSSERLTQDEMRDIEDVGSLINSVNGKIN